MILGSFPIYSLAFRLSCLREGSAIPELSLVAIFVTVY